MIKLILAFRYFIKRPITWLAVIAVSLCVFIVLVVMTVMNGLVREFKLLNYNYTGDCVVECDSLVGFGYYEEFLGLLEKQPYVKAASPVAKGVGLVGLQGTNWQNGVEVHGIVPELHAKVTTFGETLHYKRNQLPSAFDPSHAPDSDGCITGIELIPFGRRQQDGSYLYPLTPMQLELVVSVFPLNMKGGLLRPVDFVNTKTFSYCDDSHSGLVDADTMVVYLPLDQAQKLCGLDSPIKRINTIHIKFVGDANLHSSVEKTRQLWTEYVQSQAGKPGAELFENVTVQSWEENRRSIIAPMEMEQIMMTMLFLMLGIITVFIVFVVLYVIICHKSKDIGILKSIGVSTAELFSTFMVFAILVGLTGTLLGGSFGGLLLKNINPLERWLYAKFGWQLWDRTMYLIGDIPNKIEPEVVIIIIVSAIFACMMGAIVPGLQAARKSPAESLQVNQL